MIFIKTGELMQLNRVQVSKSMGEWIDRYREINKIVEYFRRFFEGDF